MPSVAEVKEKPALAVALEAVDAYLAEEVLGVVKDLVEVAHESDDDRARVSAASKVLDYVRPPKSAPLVNINMPTVVSNLGLPTGRNQVKRINPKGAIPAEPVAPRQKILPEAPAQGKKWAGHFDATDPQRPLAAPILAKPAALTSKASTPRAPDRPPAPPGILPMERQGREDE